VILMAYRANPSIADRMKVLDFGASLLQKQDAGAGGVSQTVPNPSAVSPPTSSPAPPPPMMPSEPMPEDLDALTSGKVYPNNKEALADWEQRMTDLATDITAHIGTIGQSKYTEGLDSDAVMAHSESLMAFRSVLEDARNILTVIAHKDASMVNHQPGMGGGLPPGIDLGALMNMPQAGPAGMPPGGMPMPGPMGMGGM